MSKEIRDIICPFCESEYKISYDPARVSGTNKFCCFCGEIQEDEGDDDSDD